LLFRSGVFILRKGAGRGPRPYTARVLRFEFGRLHQQSRPARAGQLRNDEMQIQSRNSERKVESSAATMGVYYEQRQIGHVLARGEEGFEAFDHAERSL